LPETDTSGLEATMAITVHLNTIDGVSKTRSFKSLAGARRFAQHHVGAAPEMSRGYAISGDGIAKVSCAGCGIAELFAVSGPTQDERIAAEEEDALLAYLDEQSGWNEEDTGFVIKPRPAQFMAASYLDSLDMPF
jgi:hypothetical protein